MRLLLRLLFGVLKLFSYGVLVAFCVAAVLLFVAVGVMGGL